MTDIELAWAAGLFEGEGTVTILRGGNRPYTRLKVCMSNTDHDIVQFFADRWPGEYRAVRRRAESHRQAWIWGRSCRAAAAFLTDIQPFVCGLRMRARIELALLSQSVRRQGTRQNVASYRETNERFMDRMRRLNVKGPNSFIDALHASGLKALLVENP